MIASHYTQIGATLGFPRARSYRDESLLVAPGLALDARRQEGLSRRCFVDDHVEPGHQGDRFFELSAVPTFASLR
jgi:hypothetical protein